MKKLFSISICLILILLSACQDQSKSHMDGMVGVESNIDVQTSFDVFIEQIKVNDYEVSLVIRNLSESDITYGYNYNIEVGIDDVWHVTQYGPSDCPAGEYLLTPGESREHKYLLFNEPPNGDYRILIQMYYPESQSNSFYVAGQFAVN